MMGLADATVIINITVRFGGKSNGEQTTAAFESFDAGLKTAAENLGKTGLTGAEARGVSALL